ncbi:MAG: 4Fe-4S binding protein [Candidatus Bipolaricaulota bacterium]|nr:MAG: 4Fe-4S binding protein [Candidatus Bipolaricaulota bacterium]
MNAETAVLCAPQRALDALIEFANDGMCGRCLPCPLATKQAIVTIERIIAGQGDEADLARLARVAAELVDAARCPKGEEAARALGESLRGSTEFERHVDGVCPEGTCRALTRFRIDPEKCTMCGACAEVCPRDAIEGDPYVPYLGDNHPYTIRELRCDGCGACVDVCEAGAIARVT